ncbi:EscT/YscT/HrcT family type III secretion system export apparatus protein [Burkholderia pseudomallei]|uniref:type III secretion system export apparatus subunit SctT n=1 Tax=Burkholderia pseudomallei TaxID=28450 RepID=UPI000977FB56|nr:type III secretion system export apparatus subunit SctT [Burkholderia pseudomallei]ONC26344.1 EscT/YscT/HrcT family type III secretion system export apparatus protein [Burkholderia pseudomallei]
MGAVAIAYARIAPVFYLLPFLNDRVVVGATLKNTIIFVLIVGLWPAMPHVPADGGLAVMLWLAVKEASVGLALGVTLVLPFWVASAIAELIDNQRGATISDSIDPATGVDASVLEPFVSLFYAAVFLQQGGMGEIVKALADSYRYVPVGALLQGNVWRIGVMLTDVLGKGISLAAPVLVMMFLSDVLLGLVSRFCPQVNAFSLSLSFKSIVAFGVFYLYFAHGLPGPLHELFDAHPLSTLLR